MNKMEKFKVDDQVFRYAVIQDAAAGLIELIPNHQERLYTPDLAKQYSCSGLVSGGFYGKDYAPIGWLVSKGQEVSRPVNSNLLNGYLAIGDEGQISIDNKRPSFKVREGVQSGPLLVMEAKPLPLNIRNDEPRRRVVAALNDQGKLSFWIITGEESYFSGPLLAELPKVMMELSKKTGVKLEQAVNLDGGSASAFITDKVTVREISSVGNFFCLH